MSCKDLKPPTVPALDKLPKGAKLPTGVDLSKAKSMASGGGLSGAMNNVSGMVSSGIKNVAAGLSPAAIAGKVGELVGGIANTIGSTVQDAMGAIAGIKNKIQSFNPADQLAKLGGVPGKILGQIQGKLDGLAEFAGLEASVDASKCGKDYISQASKVTKDLKDDAADAASKISKKDKLRMQRDPEFKKQKEEEIKSQVAAAAERRAIEEANTPDPNSKSVQTQLYSEELNVVRIDVVVDPISYFDSYVTGFTSGWSAGDTTWDKQSSTLDAVIDGYVSSIGSGEPKSAEVKSGVHIHNDMIPWVAAETLNADRFTFNISDHKGLWAEAMGQSDELDTEWETAETYTNPVHYMMSFSTTTIENKWDPAGKKYRVVTDTNIRLSYTSPVGDGNIGSKNWSFYDIKASGEAKSADALEAYKNSVKYAIDKQRKDDKLKQLIN